MNFVYVSTLTLQVSEAGRITREIFTYCVQVSTSCWGNDSIHHIWPATCGVFYLFLQLKSDSFPFTRVFLTYFILQIAKGLDLSAKEWSRVFSNVESCLEVSVEV